MKPFTLREALTAVDGRCYGDEAALERIVEGVTSDSREVGPGMLFIPLKGSHVDGHDFMAACIKAGAVANFSEREPAPQEQPAIVVDSTVRATGALAAWYRARFDIPVIGVTGSVGKTTTKEMIAAVLSQRYKTHKTRKNLTNELGVPWTLMRLEERYQVSVVEMGISSFGEMRRLTHMVRPDIAVFSLIGDAHLEFLGDREGVLRAKSEIFEGMGPEGLAVFNGDDIMLLPVGREEAAGFFNLINALHEKASVIITTNKAPTEWAKTLDDEVLATALLDRLLYRCEVVKLSGKSYRMGNRKTIFGTENASPLGGGTPAQG